MSRSDAEKNSFFGNLFQRQKTIEAEMPAAVSRPRSTPSANAKRIICLRLDKDLDRRLTRALKDCPRSRSQFIRAAIEQVLKQEGEARLYAAHSAIRWD
jgi:hypothetical protein